MNRFPNEISVQGIQTGDCYRDMTDIFEEERNIIPNRVILNGEAMAGRSAANDH